MREAAEDTILTAPELTSTSNTIFMGKGTSVIIDQIRSCRNARNFPDPSTYKPRRWESSDTASMENFTAFAVGPRLCLGRKFSMVESVCFLANILRDWKFDVKLEKGETMRNWQDRIMMQPDTGITLKLGESPPIVIIRSRLYEMYFQSMSHCW